MVDFKSIEDAPNVPETTEPIDPVSDLTAKLEAMTLERNNAIDRCNALTITNGELVAQISEISAQKQALQATSESLTVQ